MTETSCVISIMDEGDTLSGHVGSPNPACGKFLSNGIEVNKIKLWRTYMLDWILVSGYQIQIFLQYVFCDLCLAVIPFLAFRNQTCGCS